MLGIEMNINVFLFAGILFAALIIGFLLRKNQLGSLQKKINDLEREMLASHAEILQLQRDKIDILKSVSEPGIPVISITSSKEEKLENLPDVSIRKKLLIHTGTIKQSSGS